MIFHSLGLFLLAYPVLVLTANFLGEDCLSWQYGKGSGKYVQNAGTVETMSECIETVKNKFPDANGAFVDNPSKTSQKGKGGPKQLTCQAVEGQTGSDGDQNFISCFLQPGSEKDYGPHCKVAFENSNVAYKPGEEDELGQVDSMKTCIAKVKSLQPFANAAVMYPLGQRNAFGCKAVTGVTTAVPGVRGFTTCLIDAESFTPNNGEHCSAYLTGKGDGQVQSLGVVKDMASCIELVRAKDIKSNGASMSNPQKSQNDKPLECFAHSGQTKVDGNKEFVNCFIQPPAETPYGQYCKFFQEGYGYGHRGVTDTYNMGRVASMKECTEVIRKKLPEANGATMSNINSDTGEGDCQARIKQVYVTRASGYQNCFLEPSYTKPDFGPLCSFMLRGKAQGSTRSTRSLGSVNSMQECLELSKKADPTAAGVQMTNPDFHDPPYTCTQYPTLVHVETRGGVLSQYVTCFTDFNNVSISKGGEECKFFTTGMPNNPLTRLGYVQTLAECIEKAKNDMNGEVATTVTMSLYKPSDHYYSHYRHFTCHRADGYSVRHFHIGVASPNPLQQTCFIEAHKPVLQLIPQCKFHLWGGFKTSGKVYDMGYAGSVQECYDIVKAKYPEANGMEISYSQMADPKRRYFTCLAVIDPVGVNQLGGDTINCFFDGVGGAVGGASGSQFKPGLAPGPDCGYWTQNGNGDGAKEQIMGHVLSVAECTAMVQRDVPAANGATLKPTGSGSYECLAEIGQTGVITESDHFNCFLRSTSDGMPDPEKAFGPVGSGCQYLLFGANPSSAVKGKVSDATNMKQCILNVRAQYPNSLIAQFKRPQANFETSECYAVLSGAKPDGDPNYASCYLSDEKIDKEIGQLGDDCLLLQEGSGNGDKTLVGTASSMADCIDLVRWSEMAANGATLGANQGAAGRDCFAELHQTGVEASRGFHNCFIKQQNGPTDFGVDINIVDENDVIIDSDKWYYEEYPSGQEGPGGEAGFWRLPKGEEPTEANRDADDTLVYDKDGGYWRQKLPGRDPIVVPGWNVDYDGVMAAPSDKSCAVLDPDQWELEKGTWRTKAGVVLKQETLDAECIQYVDGDPGYWIVDPEAEPPTFVPGSADLEEFPPFYFIDENKNLLIDDNLFYYDGREWKLKPGVLPEDLDLDNYEYCEYPGGKVDKYGNKGYWRPKPGKNIIDPESKNSENGTRGILGQSGEGKTEEAEDIPVICDEDPWSQHLQKVEISGCSDSGHKDESRACERMTDDNYSRNVKNGGCYVSKWWRKVWAELLLAQTADVIHISLSSKSNGQKLPGTKVYVCSDEKDESCLYCSTIVSAAKETCTLVGCESVITGNRIRFVGEENGIVICDITVRSIKRANQPGVQPVTCPETTVGPKPETVGPLTVTSCKASRYKQNNQKCEKMFDKKEGKSCYVSKPTKKVFAELTLEETSEMHSVEIVGPKNAIKNVKVSVCGKSGACNPCGNTAASGANSGGSVTVQCPQPISGGVAVRFDKANGRLSLCHVIVEGKKQPGGVFKPIKPPTTTPKTTTPKTTTPKTTTPKTTTTTTTTTTTPATTTTTEEPLCPEFKGERGTSVEIDSCTSIKVKDATRACDKAYDGSLLRMVQAKVCFVSQSNKKGWAQYTLTRQYQIARVAVLPKGNGEGLLGATVEVCQSRTGSCEQLGKFSKIELNCGIVTGPPITGDVIRFSITGSALVLCEIKAFSA